MEKFKIKLGYSSPSIAVQISDQGYEFDSEVINQAEYFRESVQKLYAHNFLTRVRKNKILLDLEIRVINHVIKQNHGRIQSKI